MLMHRLKDTSYRRIVWLLPIALLVHELEEWNIRGWYETNFVNPPEVPDSALRAVLLAVSLMGFLVTAVASRFNIEKIVAYISLTFFILVSFANSLQHIYWQIAWGNYAAGVIASSILVVPITLWASAVALVQSLINRIYLGGLYLLSVINVVITAKGGNVVPPLMQNVHEIGLTIATFFGCGS